jgi:hypothetical protein
MRSTCERASAASACVRELSPWGCRGGIPTKGECQTECGHARAPGVAHCEQCLATRGPSLAACPALQRFPLAGWPHTEPGPARARPPPGPGPIPAARTRLRPLEDASMPAAGLGEEGLALQLVLHGGTPGSRGGHLAVQAERGRSSTDTSASGHRRRRRLLGQGPNESRVGSHGEPPMVDSPLSAALQHCDAGEHRPRCSESHSAVPPLALQGKGRRERHATRPSRALAMRRRRHTHGAAGRRCPPIAVARQ